MAKTIHPQMQPYNLESICRIIADTDEGLTGTEISKILDDSKIDDVSPGITKWKRLYNAFVGFQNKNGCSNNILIFLQHALHPSRYIGAQELYQKRRHEMNKALAFMGTEVSDRGTLIKVQTARTLSEAEERASHYLYKLRNRNVHAEVFKYCHKELLQENYFHSIFEAVKGIAERLRAMSGVYADGNALADTAFSTSSPRVRINALLTDTDRSEHLGLMNIVKGLFGLIRNPTAHTPKIKFVVDEGSALDIMTMVSYVHKLLDKAI